ncbi:MAG: hypothetical protein HY737_03555 [Candidatus Omnitrophica bacterium]|nr:hypothetical protein [Candidatus Omnitrophota bacterium]
MMPPGDELRQEHRHLVSSLDALECALSFQEEAWFALREMSFNLSKAVRRHLLQEERILTLVGAKELVEGLAQAGASHRHASTQLRVINRYFTEEPRHSLRRIGPLLSAMIHDLRRTIHAQDDVLRAMQPDSRDPAGLAPVWEFGRGGVYVAE